MKILSLIIIFTFLIGIVPAQQLEINRVSVSTLDKQIEATPLINPTPINNWWNFDWVKRKAIELSVPFGSTPEDYQVKIEVNHEGEMNQDFSDLRFTEETGNTELNYWVEDKENGNNAIIWIKISESITQSPQTIIYMYYGNPSADSKSNGDLTFDFFDDFDFSDNGKWFEVAGGLNAVEGIEILNNDKLIGNEAFSPGYAFEARVWGDDFVINAGGILLQEQITEVNSLTGDSLALVANYGDDTCLYSTNDDITSEACWEEDFPQKPFILTLVWSDSYVKSYKDYNLKTSIYSNVANEELFPGMWNWALRTENNYFDWYRVRKIYDSEPIALFGEEETFGVCGDLNHDYVLSGVDVVFMIDYVFRDKKEIKPFWTGDLNDNGRINVVDAALLMNHVFKGGPELTCSSDNTIMNKKNTNNYYKEVESILGKRLYVL